MNTNITRLILLTSFVSITWTGFAQNHPAGFVWKDPEGGGRQQTVLFRRSFTLDKTPSAAQIHLFADSRYHLYVNGNHLNFGPSRFYPEHPEYDTYDLVPYLTPGENVVAVEVLSNGTVTFQVPLSIGGFIAWGEINSGSGTVSLATPGNWKMLPSKAFDHQALRFSFACGPMEVFDSRKEPKNWKYPDFDDSGWKAPAVIADQEHWGELTPRTIPLLTQDELLPMKLLGVYEDAGEEELYSFFIKTTEKDNSLYNTGNRVYAATYIYSPEDKQVEVGLWWGEYFLNGEGPIKVSGKTEGNPVRQNRVMDLKLGWNFMFISYVAIWGGWDFYMAVPRGSGLVFSPDKKMDGDIFILTSGPFPEDAGIFDQEKDSPGNDKKILGNKKFNWTPMISPDRGPNPARELVWRKPDLDCNLKENNHQLTDFHLEKPTSLVFDMGSKKLGRIFIEAEAPEGTTIDIGWAEDLNSLGLPFLYKRLQVNAATRFITREGSHRNETFKPYGVRYLQIRIDPGSSPCTLQKLGVIEQLYPYEKTGSFACSNPMLDRIWELGWRTLRVCSEDSYTDTPFRERGLYAGDALPEYGISLVTSGDSRLMKRSLLLFQDMYSKNMLQGEEEGLNDFVLKTLLELHWYWHMTGDLEFVRSLYPNYHSLMNHILARPNEEGYFPTRRVFIEWTRIDKNADLTAYQALLVRSLFIMSELAGDLGYEADSGHYTFEAEKLRTVVNRLFWDKEMQVYHDGFKDGKMIDHHYPISSVYPLLFDFCDISRQESILAYLEHELVDIGEETRNRKISPYGSFYLFAALYKYGRADLAEKFMLQYWSRMIHQGDDTSWENFDIRGEDGGGQGTASHAWSGHPTYFLSTEVLGVKLGFNQNFHRDLVEIRPQSGTLKWARGTVPHPAGPVDVEWRIEGERLIMHLALPEGVDYLVEPQGRLGQLILELNVKIQNSF